MTDVAQISRSAQMDEWHAFLENAVGALRLASEDLRANPAAFQAKNDWFRDKNSNIPRENSVSRALVELIKRMQARQAISGTEPTDLDLRHVTVECERPRPFDTGISDRSNPTDIAITLYKDGELDLRIEAKTIVTNAEIKHYTGEEGLLRFEDAANPYTVAPFGAMVAYVVDEDSQTWDQRISRGLSTAVGPHRLLERAIGTRRHSVSKHEFVHLSDGKATRYEVEVVHFALEIDAVPSMRLPKATSRRSTRKIKIR